MEGPLRCTRAELPQSSTIPARRECRQQSGCPSRGGEGCRLQAASIMGGEPGKGAMKIDVDCWSLVKT